MPRLLSWSTILFVLCLNPIYSFAADSTQEGTSVKIPKKSGIDFTVTGLGSFLYIPLQERTFDAPIRGLFRASVANGRFRRIKARKRKRPYTAEQSLGGKDFFYCSPSRARPCTIDERGRPERNELRRLGRLSLQPGPDNIERQNMAFLNGNFIFLTIKRGNFAIQRLDGDLLNRLELARVAIDLNAVSTEFFTEGTHTFLIQGSDLSTIVVTDGTPEGTMAVENWDGIRGYEPNIIHYEPNSQNFYFPGSTSDENSLFTQNVYVTSNQFERPTVAVENYSFIDSIMSIEQLGGTSDLYLTARARETINDSLVHGLFKIDTTLNTMTLLKDLGDTTFTEYGKISSKLVPMNGSLYFSAVLEDDTTKVVLWKSDGTADGTVEVRRFNTQTSGGPSGNLNRELIRPRLELLNDELLVFHHSDTVENETQIWINDGVSADSIALLRDGQSNFNLRKSVTRPGPDFIFSEGTLAIPQGRKVYRYTVD